MKKKILFLFIGLFLTGCSETRSVTETILLDPVNSALKTTTAQYRDIIEMDVLSAQVSPYVLELYFSRDGVFGQYDVMLGEAVTKGQLLVSTSTLAEEEEYTVLEKSLEDRIEGYENAVDKDNRSMEILQLELDRLWEQLEGLSGEEFTQKCVEIGEKDQEIRALELSMEQKEEMELFEEETLTEQLNDLKDKMGNNNIYAPFDGTIVAISNYTQGDSVTSGSEIIAIADPADLMMTCEYKNESAMNQLQNYYGYLNGADYTLEYLPYDKATYQALLLKEETPVSTFRILDPDENIQPGDQGVLIMIDQILYSVLSVPEETVYKDSISSYVYKDVNGTKIRVDVETGESDGMYIEIKSGLEEGDIIYEAD